MKHHRRTSFIALVLAAGVVHSLVTPVQAEGKHAIAMHGVPKLDAGYTHFPYVNPNAPKGGVLTLGETGTFDNLNPFIVRGVAPTGIRSYIYESLLARSADEPFALYGLIAERLEVPDDRSSITFHLDRRARFADGKAVTAADVAFTHDLLRRKGRPYMRSHYGKVAKVEVLGTHSIRFAFDAAGDREIPLIMGLMPILPKHATDEETFEQTTLAPPLGSGPYTISKVVPGHSVTFRRNRNHWSRDLPARRGLFNFDEIRLNYFRNSSALFEAFKSGNIDYRMESDPARWIDSYDFPAIREGRVKKHAFETGLPAGMTGFVFNTRRSKFADQRVRRAFVLAFDANRINRQMFHGRYIRSASYFARSDLAASGRPASADERALLGPHLGAVKPSLLDGSWQLPKVTDRRATRANLKAAFGLLKEAGYRLAGRKLVEAKSGKPFTVEFLVTTREQERLALAFGADLKKLGIAPSIRQMEDSQYWARLGTFDFDIIQWTYRASLSPGNEQIHRWHSRYANVERSYNYPGVKNKAVDAMIDALLKAKEHDEFVAAVRAFDRVLLSGDYVVPMFHDPKQWIAANARLSFPKQTALFGVDLNTWWFARD